MRQRLAVRLSAVPLVGVLAAASLTACSGTDLPVKVSGEFGRRPEVSIPKDDPKKSREKDPGKDPKKRLTIATLHEGDGTKVGRGDLVVADYVSYRWSGSGNKLIASSYAAGQPGAFPLGKLVPGLEKALRGKKAGSRVVAVIPPKDGYGANGAPQQQVGGDDSLVYVLDVRAVYPPSAAARGRAQPALEPSLPQVTAPPRAGRDPAVRMPPSRPPGTLQVRGLIRGEGPEVRKGQLLAMQYAGLFWRDGKVFSSSWTSGRPYAAVIGTGQVVKGWDDGLVGQRVGSRLLLVVPPRWGYGGKGLKQAGIKGDDTLVFVVDILGAR